MDRACFALGTVLKFHSNLLQLHINALRNSVGGGNKKIKLHRSILPSTKGTSHFLCPGQSNFMDFGGTIGKTPAFLVVMVAFA